MIFSLKVSKSCQIYYFKTLGKFAWFCENEYYNRDNGPAVEYDDGFAEWWSNDELLNEEYVR